MTNFGFFFVFNYFQNFSTWLPFVYNPEFDVSTVARTLAATRSINNTNKLLEAVVQKMNDYSFQGLSNSGKGQRYALDAVYDKLRTFVQKNIPSYNLKSGCAFFSTHNDISREAIVGGQGVRPKKDNMVPAPPNPKKRGSGLTKPSFRCGQELLDERTEYNNREGIEIDITILSSEPEKLPVKVKNAVFGNGENVVTNVTIGQNIGGNMGIVTVGRNVSSAHKVLTSQQPCENQRNQQQQPQLLSEILCRQIQRVE